MRYKVEINNSWSDRTKVFYNEIMEKEPITSWGELFRLLDKKIKEECEEFDVLYPDKWHIDTFKTSLFDRQVKRYDNDYVIVLESIGTTIFEIKDLENKLLKRIGFYFNDEIN